MPQEIRNIIFDDREVRQMVVNWLASRGDRHGIIGTQIDVGTEQDGVFLRMSCQAPDTLHRHALVVAGRDALAAAILFCRSRRVMLPMKADKHLEVVRGSLTLVVSSQSTV